MKKAIATKLKIQPKFQPKFKTTTKPGPKLKIVSKAKIADNVNLDELIKETGDLQIELRELQKKMDENKEKLLATFQARRLETQECGKWRAKRVESYRSSINVDKLVQLGVGAHIIHDATDKKAYSYIRIDEASTPKAAKNTKA
jgi:hypothetical protein